LHFRFFFAREDGEFRMKMKCQISTALNAQFSVFGSVAGTS